MGTVAVPLLLIILKFKMVTAVSRLCACSKCGEWRHVHIHSGAIVKSQEQWEANPRVMPVSISLVIFTMKRATQERTLTTCILE
jgi:hypothetical protein